MKKLNIFIDDHKTLNDIVKGLHLEISKDEHNRLVSELYSHIRQTRLISFKNGYDQGKFDEQTQK